MSPNSNTKLDLQNNNGQEDDIDLEYDEYLDDEPQRKPKHGKSLRKFKHPAEY